MDADSLFSEFDVSDSLSITIYDPQKNWESIKSFLLGKNEQVLESKEKIEGSGIIERPDELVNMDFYVAAAIFILFLFGILKVSDRKLFGNVWDFNSIISIKIKIDSDLERNTFTPQYIFLLIILSLTISYLLLFAIDHQFVHQPKIFAYVASMNMTFYWFFLSLGVLTVLFIKYVVLVLVSSIFSVSNFAKIYFFEFIRTTFVMYIGVLLFVTFYSLISKSGFWLDNQWVLVFFTVLILMRVIFLYAKSIRLTSFNHLHLFSYLCPIEIIPSLIILNFIFE
jgi:hypothetical protein